MTTGGPKAAGCIDPVLATDGSRYFDPNITQIEV